MSNISPQCPPMASADSNWITVAPPSETDIQDWLAAQIGEQLGIESDDIELHTPFHTYGLQSVQAMAIAGLGKQRFGLEISPLTLWNCPNIASLSQYIAKELALNENESFEI